MADCRRALHRASAHLFLQQNGAERGHDAGGERECSQAASGGVISDNAVSINGISEQCKRKGKPIVFVCKNYSIMKKLERRGEIINNRW